MRLRVGPVLTQLVSSTLEEHGWLIRTLTVQQLVASFHSPTHACCFFDMISRTFYTGLLGHVQAAAAVSQVPLDLDWAPAAIPHGFFLDPALLASPQPNGKMFRPYQVEGVVEALTKGRGIFQNATASGKTALIGGILRFLGNPSSLVLAGNRGLVGQTKDEVSAWLGEPVGEATARNWELGPSCIVATAPCLAARGEDPDVQALLATREVVIVDEAHHASSAPPVESLEANKPSRSGSWVSVLSSCPAPNRYGFSATALKAGDPEQNWRVTGVLGPLFDTSIPCTDLIEQEYAARPFIYYVTYPRAPGLTRKMNYVDSIRYGIVECEPRNLAVMEAAKVLWTRGLKVLVLVEQIEHGRLLHALLSTQSRIPDVRFISGSLTEKDLEWLKSDRALVCVATRVLGEGVNVPDIGAVVYARGGKSYVNLFQAIGRGLRKKGAATGLCIVVDFVDSYGCKNLTEHYEQRRVLVSREAAFRVAEEGQSLSDFVDAVLKLGRIEDAATLREAPAVGDGRVPRG